MQYYNGSIYFVYHGCLYKNDTVIINSGTVNDAFVSSRGIYYLSENKYIALHKTPFYCTVDSATTLACHPQFNWFAAYSSDTAYIIRPNFKVYKRYSFPRTISHAWMFSDNDIGQLYLCIACNNYIYITDGMHTRRYRCNDDIVYGNEHFLCHSSGLYIPIKLREKEVIIGDRVYTVTPEKSIYFDKRKVSNIIVRHPINKATLIDTQVVIKEYGFCVIFSCGNDIYALISDYDGRAYTSKIASNVDDWTVAYEPIDHKYRLFIRRHTSITVSNLEEELSYIIFADPSKQIPHYPSIYTQLEFQQTSAIETQRISVIHSIIRSAKRAIQYIIKILPKLFSMFLWYLFGAFIANIIRLILESLR